LVLARPQSSNTCLGGQLELLSLHDLCDVEIEEVAVEDCLDAAGNDGDDVVERFSVVPVDPVEDVETSVGAESEEIVASDGLCLAGLAHHEQLGKDCNGLKVDGEGPEDLHSGELVVQHQSQQRHRGNQELDPEGVVIAVVGCLELNVHQVDGCGRRGDEEDLHTGIVQRDEVGEQVKVPGHKNDEEKNLRFARDTGA